MPFADVVVGADPELLVQASSQATGEVTWTISNAGELETSITLERQGAFFTQSPEAFVLGPFESRTITVTAIPQPPGTYNGFSIPKGDGVPTGLRIPITLISTTTPAGTVLAEASTPRVDLSGDRSTSASGSVSFQNRGTASLVGVASSDVDWLIPQAAR